MRAFLNRFRLCYILLLLSLLLNISCEPQPVPIDQRVVQARQCPEPVFEENDWWYAVGDGVSGKWRYVPENVYYLAEGLKRLSSEDREVKLDAGRWHWQIKKTGTRVYATYQRIDKSNDDISPAMVVVLLVLMVVLFLFIASSCAVANSSTQQQPGTWQHS